MDQDGSQPQQSQSQQQLAATAQKPRRIRSQRKFSTDSRIQQLATPARKPRRRRRMDRQSQQQLAAPARKPGRIRRSQRKFMTPAPQTARIQQFAPQARKARRTRRMDRQTQLPMHQFATPALQPRRRRRPQLHRQKLATQPESQEGEEGWIDKASSSSKARKDKKEST